MPSFMPNKTLLPDADFSFLILSIIENELLIFFMAQMPFVDTDIIILSVSLLRKMLTFVLTLVFSICLLDRTIVFDRGRQPSLRQCDGKFHLNLSITWEMNDLSFHHL
ncbi:hypothetical protein T4D_6565 [Trichinella pseudospiralis]|uniref:Uncharacterized protein n=1 Tax=Trichinella pseudospiralis TaxID=6337 RepID=A0A0V1FP05_TRIPS|nr:hypothetical protein T4D_6565 [Trichinella pseudospiralis]